MRQQFYVLPALLLLSLLLAGTQPADAQIYDLDDLRRKPDSTGLKIDKPAPEIRPVSLPVSALDLKVKYWRHWSSFGINANQASFSENWKAGGVNSISVGALIDHKSEYKYNNTTFTTQLNLQYGKQKNKDQLPRKNNDRIFWDNVLSWRVSPKWSLYTSVRFESQFDVGYSYRRVDGNEQIDTIISNFMAPGRLTENLGIEYKPDNTFSVRFGTGAAMQTFVLDDRLVTRPGEPLRFGVENERRFRNDLAFDVTAVLNRDLTSTLHIFSRYNLFAGYKDLSDPRHDLEARLTARVTRLVNVQLHGRLIYNSVDDPNVQTSQTLALGLLFKLPR